MDTGNIDTTAAVAALATVSAITSSGGTTLTTAMEQQAINLATGYLCSKKAEPGKKAAAAATTTHPRDHDSSPADKQSLTPMHGPCVIVLCQLFGSCGLVPGRHGFALQLRGG